MSECCEGKNRCIDNDNKKDFYYNFRCSCGTWEVRRLTDTRAKCTECRVEELKQKLRRFYELPY